MDRTDITLVMGREKLVDLLQEQPGREEELRQVWLELIADARTAPEMARERYLDELEEAARWRENVEE